jgi:hypothetical protein
MQIEPEGSTPLLPKPAVTHKLQSRHTGTEILSVARTQIWCRGGRMGDI